MDTNPYSIAAILTKKFKKEELTDFELRSLAYWLRIPKNKALHDELLKEGQVFDLIWLNELDNESAWEQVIHKRKAKKYFWLRWSAAAAILCFMSVGAYVFWGAKSWKQSERIVKTEHKKYNNDVLPAIMGAKIKLASGEEIIVKDSLDITSHNMLSDNQNKDQLGDNKDLPLNSLIVPPANFFKLLLADGTKVWVNAESELHFPKAFTGKERRVFLKGEAYFDVKKDLDKPFYVETEDMLIRVLGTQFNVSAYKQHSITTLEEGSVEVFKEAKSVVITPGECVEWGSGKLRVKKADLLRDLSWKNNVFYFKEDNIVNIAYQLKRWYDLNIQIARDVSLTDTYSGEIKRDVKLTEVLTMLEFVSALEFKIDRNNLLIRKSSL